MSKLTKHVLVGLLFLIGATAVANAQHYQERRSWVTDYLENGGDIKNITGLKRPLNWRREARAQEKFHDVKAESNLPSKFDWNDYFKLQPIKNQASCGSCWAFSITAVIESLYWIKNGGNNNNWFDLSEQTLVSSCERGGSCSGGYFTAFDYVQQSGLPHESDDPYTARNSSCKEGLQPVQKVIEWKYVGNGNASPTTEQIKTAIWHYGPVSVDVNGGFGSYGSGVYTGCGSSSPNHMVTIEGWVDDEQYAEYGGGYWIMRNSWGTSWGEDGYMRIVYTSKRGGKCNGIGGTTAYAIIEGLEPQKALRQRLGAKYTELMKAE